MSADTGPLWICQALVTDGLRPPRKAIKLEVMRDEEPEIQYLKWLEAQCTGQYRVHYQEWPPGRSHARFRVQHEPDNWITVSDVVGQGRRDVGS